MDLGRTLQAVAEREPDAVALVDGDRRLTYAELLERAGRISAALAARGFARGDHLVSVLANRVETCLLHWACQLGGVIATPANWRASAAELDHVITDADAVAVVFDRLSVAAVEQCVSARRLPCFGVADAVQSLPGAEPFEALLESTASDLTAHAMETDSSLMLYTSGTTGRPKGVPRTHRAERTAALAHVAQNRYAYGERTLGVMPLYHTMGIRSLLAMALLNGRFVCQARFDAGEALELIEREGVQNLYLVPTLYHDLLEHPGFSRERVVSVRKLGFAGAPMTDGLLERLARAFEPDLFVNHYGSSEVYTFTVCPDAVAKPGSAGKAGINQRIRVLPIGSSDPHGCAAPGEEGQIAASLDSEEAFSGYWRRPDADARALHDGWYFTGDIGYFDAEGDLFVTGRVDDMIISGGENIMPVEIESVLSLHPNVAEVAVVGQADERLGQRVTAFVRAAGVVTGATLDAYCRESDLARFKRPREYVFVRAIPKSPVGKILRRLLQAGEYERA